MLRLWKFKPQITVRTHHNLLFARVLICHNLTAVVMEVCNIVVKILVAQ